MRKLAFVKFSSISWERYGFNGLIKSKRSTLKCSLIKRCFRSSACFKLTKILSCWSNNFQPSSKSLLQTGYFVSSTVLSWLSVSIHLNIKISTLMKCSSISLKLTSFLNISEYWLYWCLNLVWKKRVSAKCPKFCWRTSWMKRMSWRLKDVLNFYLTSTWARKSLKRKSNCYGITVSSAKKHPARRNKLGRRSTNLS